MCYASLNQRPRKMCNCAILDVTVKKILITAFLKKLPFLAKGLIGMVNKLKSFIPTFIMLTLYHTLIHSHFLSYGIMVWGHNCDRLIKIQKKALRVVNLSKYNAHCDPLFKVLKLPDLLKLQELKTYFKFVHSELPSYILELPLDLNVNIH